MVKHNNAIQNLHFRKDWQRRVVTWFDQPAAKARRRNNRVERAKKLAPRPINSLKPIVRCTTVKYNGKIRAGRGFTLDELKKAGINKKEAAGLGIAVDWRRRNISEEGLNKNVQRLKLYKSKLVVFPRNGSSKKVKQGDSTKEELASAKQVNINDVFGVRQPKSRVKARKITSEEKKANVVQYLRKVHLDTRLWGRRLKRQADKEAAEKLKTKKKK